jgi:hypothetical protein
MGRTCRSVDRDFYRATDDGTDLFNGPIAREKDMATMSAREQRGLRGPVKSCTEKRTSPDVRDDNEGKTYAAVSWEDTTEYDMDGRMLSTRSSGSDGPVWVMRHTYDASGRLLKIASGNQGEQPAETIFVYNDNGDLAKTTGSDAPENPAAFHYDDRGRRTKVQVSRAEDYRPNMASAGSPFEILDCPPNLPGGGTATTIYDEHDRATEVEVRDAEGELVSRAVRKYDAHGRVLEEKQMLDKPEAMFSADIQAEIFEQSGMSPEQLSQEMRAQLTKLMGGQPEPYLISYSYDTHSRVNHTSRRIYNHKDEIQTTYNEHGDVSSEVRRDVRVDEEADPSTAVPGPLSYSEVRYSYKYDDRENWIEKASSYRSNPAAMFQPSTVIKRVLTYY